jgi:hypothetical protein
MTHRAVLAHDAGDYRAAAQILSQTLRHLPPNDDTLRAWYAFGDSLAKLGDRESARMLVEQVRRAERLPPEYEAKFTALRAAIGGDE